MREMKPTEKGLNSAAQTGLPAQILSIDLAHVADVEGIFAILFAHV